MRKILILTLVMSSLAYAGGEFKAKIGFKIGSGFSVKSEKIRGSFSKISSDHFEAKKIRASLSKMFTGNETRDSHMRDRFSGPSVVIKNAKAKNGKGTATITMNKISKKEQFNYKKAGKKLKIDLKVNLSDYKLKGISYGDILLKDEVKVVGKVDIK